MKKTYHMFSRRGNTAVSRLVNGVKENSAGIIKFGGSTGMKFALKEGIQRIAIKHPEVEAFVTRESIAFEFVEFIPIGIRYSIWLDPKDSKEEMQTVRENYLQQKFPGI